MFLSLCLLNVNLLIFKLATQNWKCFTQVFYVVHVIEITMLGSTEHTFWTEFWYVMR